MRHDNLPADHSCQSVRLVVCATRPGSSKDGLGPTATGGLLAHTIELAHDPFDIVKFPLRFDDPGIGGEEPFVHERVDPDTSGFSSSTKNPEEMAATVPERGPH